MLHNFLQLLSVSQPYGFTLWLKFKHVAEKLFIRSESQTCAIDFFFLFLFVKRNIRKDYVQLKEECEPSLGHLYCSLVMQLNIDVDRPY